MTSPLFAAILHSCGLTHRELFLYEAHCQKTNRDFESPTLQDLHESGIWVEKATKVHAKILSFSRLRLEKLIQEKDISIVLHSGSFYPKGLSTLTLRPFLLYVRGKLPDVSKPLLACVGSRKHSLSAKKNIEALLSPLVAQGWGIVSGGAYGVDALAHQAALDCGGYTLAVFGTGVDVFYPSSHKSLFERIIASGGACVSHFPLASKPEAYHFPQRNALIAGISRGVLVAEAGFKSGTLITATLALEYSRDTFAIPGNMLDPYFLGSNKLLANGWAKMVLETADILAEYNTPIIQQQLFLPKKEVVFESDIEKSVYTLLEFGPKDASFLCDKLELDASELLPILTLMEMREIITQSAGGYLIS